MQIANDRGTGGTFPYCPTTRGYIVTYHENEVNFCPGCGRSQWLIGRMLAECAYCGTAVPLAEGRIQSASGGHSRNRKLFVPADLAA